MVGLIKTLGPRKCSIAHGFKETQRSWPRNQSFEQRTGKRKEQFVNFKTKHAEKFLFSIRSNTKVQDTEPRTNGERKLCCVVIGQLGAGWRLIFVLTYGWRLYQILKSHLAQLWAVCRPLKDAVRLGHSCRRLCAASDSVIHEDGIFISTTTFAMEELHPKEEIPGKKYLTTRLQFIWLQERF